MIRDQETIDKVVATSYSLREAAAELGLSYDALKSLRKRLRAADPTRPALPVGRKASR